jgi:hypothetical protein
MQRLIDEHRKRMAPEEDLMAMVKSMVHINHSQEVFDEEE